MYYQIEKLDGYYRIGSAEAVFSYLVVGRQRALLIDTGYGLGDLKAAVDSLTSLPLLIVNTHGHCDHVGGNARFDVPCYIHPLDMELAGRHTAPALRRENAQRLSQSRNYETGEVFNALPEGFDPDAYAALGAGKLKSAREGMRFDLGGAELELIEPPGHTAGGLSILWREKKLLFVGDAAMAPSALYRKGGNAIIGLYNKETGMEWFQKFNRRFKKQIWLNPILQEDWDWAYGSETIHDIGTVFPMFELTLDGLEAGIKKLLVK